MNKFCQSCGMPMKKDPENGGTNDDGSKSPDYCSYCYRDGAFTSPEIATAADMQRFCSGKLREMGMPAFMAWLFTRSIPQVETVEGRLFVSDAFPGRATGCRSMPGRRVPGVMRRTADRASAPAVQSA